MTCATGWLQAILAGGQGGKRLVVVDEAWAVLHDLATARWLQATFKLARAMGVANVAVVHRLSDLQAAGAAGSAQQQLAEGLLADTETRVVFGQAPSEAEPAASCFALDRQGDRAGDQPAPRRGALEGGGSVVPGRASRRPARGRPGRHRRGHA